MIKRDDYNRTKGPEGKIDALATALGLRFENGAYVKNATRAYTARKGTTKAPVKATAPRKRTNLKRFTEDLYDDLRALPLNGVLDITDYVRTAGVTYAQAAKRVSQWSWYERNEKGVTYAYRTTRSNWRIFVTRTA